MKPLSVYHRRRIARTLSWTAAIAAASAAFAAYRWAEPTPQALRAAQTAAAGGATVRLTNTPFAGYVDGARTWSIRAGQVDIQRMPGTALTSIQDATILDIREGALYDPPRTAHRTNPRSSHPSANASAVWPPSTFPTAPRSVGNSAAALAPPRVTVTGPGPARTMSAAGPAENSGPINATFRAREGHYTSGGPLSGPPDLQMLYNVQWQFQLAGDVLFRTRAKDELTAPSMTIYQLVNRKTGLAEKRIVCEQGAKMTHLGVKVTANSLRFTPKDRTVECLSGVRGAYKGGSVQAERVYWSLDDEVLRCPEAASGIMKAMPFSANGLTMDVKRGKYHADHIHILLNENSLEHLKE